MSRVFNIVKLFSGMAIEDDGEFREPGRSTHLIYPFW
jgi:hypothetical protein